MLPCHLLPLDSRAQQEQLCLQWNTCWEDRCVLWISAGSLQSCVYSCAAITCHPNKVAILVPCLGT